MEDESPTQEGVSPFAQIAQNVQQAVANHIGMLTCQVIEMGAQLQALQAENHRLNGLVAAANHVPGPTDVSDTPSSPTLTPPTPS